ncbi:MAG: hypothetical protein JHC33_09520 [Ignisphaera sp.]|nr:hypothetical protein [Ignisphaera sp.]
MNFKEWYDINPYKDKIDSYNLSEKEKQKLTPVVTSSSFLIEIRKYYMEFVQRKQRYIVPDFIRSEFPIFYKKRYFSILSYYDLDIELKYLTKHIPEASALKDSLIIKDSYKDLLSSEMKFFDLSIEAGLPEVIRVKHDNRVLGFKFKVDRPK